jgi:uncharacterized protein involved in outer membrane biogenesis
MANKRLIKKIAKIMGLLIIIFLMMLGSIYWYVSSHKQALLSQIQQQFHSSLNGTLLISDIEPSIGKQFPNISFVLKDICIRDSQWAQHHHDFVRAKKLFVQVKLWPLLMGKFQVRKFILSDGFINLFEDKNGYNNRSIFQKDHRQQKPNRDNDVKLRRLELENIRFSYNHYHHFKNFDFDIIQLNAWIDHKNTIKNIHSIANITVNQLSFNTHKGAFLKDKKVTFDLQFTYDTKQNNLVFDQQKLMINDNVLNISALFQLGYLKQDFSLEMYTPRIDYKEAVSWMSPNIRRPLNSFMLAQPIALSVNISGRLNHQRNPWVRLKSLISNNTLQTKFGQFDSVNMIAQFNNGGSIDTIYGDRNSSIKIDGLRASYQGIPFTADSTYVYNLNSPAITTLIRSEFDIKKLNALIGKNSFRYGAGTAKINLKYVGSISKKNDTTADIDGDIHIQNGAVNYLPRQLEFTHCNINLHLHNQDIELKESSVQTKKSTISLSGIAKNFLGLYIHYPEKVVFEAQIHSHRIDLNEFQQFLIKRTASDVKKSKSGSFNMPDAIDKTFDLSQTNLSLGIHKLVYKKFEANNIKAQLSLLHDGISLNQVQLDHADGHINLNGRVYENDADNTLFYLNAKIQKVAVDKLLYGFGSFGQATFLPENIKGNISLNSNLSGRFNSRGQFVLGSLKGDTYFELANGELINFKPLIKMGKIIFKRKRLEKVRFASLKNNLSINGNAIHIPPMMIRSDLINMQIGGVFNLHNGTDVDIEIPLFGSDNDSLSKNNEQNGSIGGYKVYVKGKDDEQGNIHFKWSLKNKEIEAARAERKRAKQKRELNK